MLVGFRNFHKKMLQDQNIVSHAFLHIFEINFLSHKINDILILIFKNKNKALKDLFKGMVLLLELFREGLLLHG